MAKYELSQAEWKKLMGNNPSKFQGESLPVEVSWEDCREFCKKSRLSLPTEAQWEYACRARSTTIYAFGNTLTTKQANCQSSRGSVAVNSFEPNAFGLYNMHGNVWEWCEDVFDAEFYSRPESVGPDPVATSGSEYRVIRGGSWFCGADCCPSANRSGHLPSSRRHDFGFRPVF